MTSKVKVITWNILASEWITKKDYPDIKQSELFNTIKRIKTIIEKLKTYNADIILLQEVMPDEYKIINKIFKDEYYITEIQPIKWSYKNNDNHKSESGNVTLIKLTKYIPLKINKDKDIDINDYPEHNIQHFCMFTQCRNIDNNKIINIYNIHFDDLSSVKRNKQMTHILDFDNEINKKSKIKTQTQSSCIIAGDFNQVYRENSKLYNIPKFTVNNFCNTYYINKNINIDNILTRGFKEDKTLSKCTNLSINTEDIFKKIGSDHTPVIANLVL
jgi:endonuclease/exonuclease/phosphatase family metal-dependent hydrolase